MLGRWAFRLGLLGAILLALLWIANFPFYAGAAGPHWKWRMEHGRLRVVHRAEAANAQSFYVAPNSEGSKFLPEWDLDGADKMVNVPLWIPLGACAGLAIWGRRRSRRDRAEARAHRSASALDRTS